MPRSHLVAYLVIAVAIGFLGGVMFQHGRTPSPEAAPSKGGTAEAGETPKNSVPVPAPALSTATSRAERAIAEKRWPEAVASIREVIASGEPAWDDALELILRILNVEDVVEYTLREEALDPLAREIRFHKYAVPLAQSAGTFSSELYLELAFTWLGQGHESKFLLESLDDAMDDELPRILLALEGNVTADMLEPLAKRTREAKGDGLKAQYLKTIVSFGSGAEAVLRELAKSPDRSLAEGASAALQFLKPSATGFLILNVPNREDRPNGQGKPRPYMAALLKRGDIITHVAEAKIDSAAAWAKAAPRFAGRGMIELKVFRDGATVTVNWPMPLGAPKGKFVSAAK